MSYGIIGTVLACVLSRESEAVGSSIADGNSVVDEVYVLCRPLLVVLNEPVVEVPCGNIIGTVFIVPYILLRLRHAYLSDDRLP